MAQNTMERPFLANAVVNTHGQFLDIVPPSYKDFISPIALRRMAKGVKNSIVASTLALNEADVTSPDAIVTGTGLGCVEDSERFLNMVLDNNEAYLTPTSFIQSTHNAVGTQIALGLNCKAYNVTYGNSAISFETALLDAKLLVDADEASTVLVGGVDEMTPRTLELLKRANIIKQSADIGGSLLNSTSLGVVYGEGASFFVLQDEISPSSYAQLVDVTITNKLTPDEVPSEIEQFLSTNGLTVKDVDAIILGYNGDASTDGYYTNLCNQLFVTTPQLYYKHLCGEFNTASAFGLWLAANLLKNQTLPPVAQVNTLTRPSYKKILLYNQYQGLDHSFVLLSSI